jgi:hypothetical protein
VPPRLSSSSPSHCQPGPTRQRTTHPCLDNAARPRAPRPGHGRSGHRRTVGARPYALLVLRGALTSQTPSAVSPPLPLKMVPPPSSLAFPVPPLLFRSDCATGNPPSPLRLLSQDPPLEATGNRQSHLSTGTPPSWDDPTKPLSRRRLGASPPVLPCLALPPLPACVVPTGFPTPHHLVGRRRVAAGPHGRLPCYRTHAGFAREPQAVGRFEAQSYAHIFKSFLNYLNSKK